jgi:benzoyl-CoA reductase/2-hydroxyglutaryl-CoA dehydratase subunit BcrC/BadD/HgdB
MKDLARRITSADWEERMRAVPEAYQAECTFLRSIIPGGVRYLFSPHEYSCRGDTLLSRLRFDGGLASLRLWAFLFSEKDRLFLAKEKGWKIFAAMKDLGQVPILTYAAPKTLTFYADELWWAPCFSEEPHLLDAAAEAGATEELCYVRAALGAYRTLDYFPRPDLSFAGVGSCCDDFSAVMQLIEAEGHPIHWWEIPTRFEESPLLRAETFKRTPHGNSPYQPSAVDFLVGEYEEIVRHTSEVTGRPITDADLRASIQSFNRIRRLVSELRELVYGARRPPLPGLEMLLAEFIAIHTCSEPEEAPLVLEDLLALARRRTDEKASPFQKDPLRVFWVTPPTDAAVVTLLEDLGGCVTGSEYLISHAFYPLDEEKPPLRAVAENYMDDPLIGASEFRARRIVEGARRFGAEGVLITGIFGASHCPYEDRVITEAVQKELGLPVLSFDIPYSPGRLSEQVVNRMQGFVELLASRRAGASVPGWSPPALEDAPAPGDPFEYFRNSMAHEADFVRAEKRRGRGIVGIYCEFTPRDLILAAGALPVCLCGSSQRTVAPAETVLPANLCPLIKSSFGYILTSRCPFYVVADLVVAETTCDGKKKMFEMLAERKETHVLELTQKVDEERAFLHWLEEVRELGSKLESFFHVEITDQGLRHAISEMNQERSLLKKAMLLGARRPSIVSGTELALLRYRVSGNPAHIRMIEKFIETVEARAADGFTVAPASARRVLLTGCPTAQGSEKVIEIVEASGGVVVVQEACSGIKPIDTLVAEDGDPLTAIARKHFEIPCSCMTPNTGRTELIRRLVTEFEVDAVLDLVWHACHTYNVEAFFIERFVRNELGLPYLKIETDYSASDREQLGVRIQTLLEIS